MKRKAWHIRKDYILHNSFYLAKNPSSDLDGIIFVLYFQGWIKAR